MTFKERIEALEPEEIPRLDAGQREWVAGYFHCTEDAAQIAAEADALMEEMAYELLEFLEWIKMGDYDRSFIEGAESVLKKHRKYKDE